MRTEERREKRRERERNPAMRLNVIKLGQARHRLAWVLGAAWQAQSLGAVEVDLRAEEVGE